MVGIHQAETDPHPSLLELRVMESQEPTQRERECSPHAGHSVQSESRRGTRDAGGLCWGSMLGSLHWEGLCSWKSALGCLCWGSSVGYLHWRAYPGWVGPGGICPGGVCPGGPLLGALHCVCTCTKPAPKSQCLLGAAAVRPLTGCQAPAAQALGLGSHPDSDTPTRAGPVPATPGPLPKRSQPPCCACPKSQPPAHRNRVASTCWHALPAPCCMPTFPLLLAWFPHPPSP